MSWTRWPYDPQDVGREAIDEALKHLRQRIDEGMHCVERALGALDVAAGMVPSRVHDMSRYPDTLARLDEAAHKVQNYLDKASDEIYGAVKEVEF